MAKNVRHKLPQKIKTDWTLCYIVFFAVLSLHFKQNIYRQVFNLWKTVTFY